MLEKRNASLNASNNNLTAHQLKRRRRAPASQGPSSTTSVSSVSQPSSALSAASGTSHASENDSDKLIVKLAKKYALTTEMFQPEQSIFQTECPDPPADISSSTRYAKKGTEKAALVTELYASIDDELHPQMHLNSFYNLVRSIAYDCS